MANSFSNWAEGVAKLASTFAAAGVVVAATLVPLPARAQTPPYELSDIANGLNAFAGLRRDLGLGSSPILRAVQAEVRSVANAPATSLVAALCQIVAPEKLPGTGAEDGSLDTACLAGIADLDALQARVLEQQEALLSAAETGKKRHEDAYNAFIEQLFVTVVCREGSDICDGDPKATRVWWSTTGKRALMVLDRIGREHIKLTERLVEQELDNARDHVVSRLDRVLARQDVKIAVRVLLQADSATFGALGNPSAGREAKLRAVAAVSSWIQKSIADSFAKQLATLPKNTLGLPHLEAALARAARESKPGSAEYNAVDAIVANFMESRQRLVEIVVLGRSLTGTTQCKLPDPGLLMGPGQEEPKPTRPALEQAFQGLGDFLRACKPGERSISALVSALLGAAPGEPGALDMAQALCRFGPKLDAEALQPLRVRLLRGVPAALGKLLDGSGRDACEIVEALPTRRETAVEYLAIQRQQAEAVKDSAKLELLTAAERIISLPDAAMREELSRTLDHMDTAFWAAGHLLSGDLLLDKELVASLGSCHSPAGPLAVTWRLEAPTFAVNEDGKLALTFEGEIALCRPMKPRAPIGATDEERAKLEQDPGQPLSALWRFARAQGRLPINLEGRFPADGEIKPQQIADALTQLGKDLVNAIPASFTLDREGLKRYARAELAGRDKPVTDANVEELLRRDLADAVRRTIDVLELREFLASDSFHVELSDDGTALVLEFRVDLPGEREDPKFCAFVPLGGAAPAPAKDCVGINEIKDKVWDQVQAELEARVLAPLWAKAETELVPLVARFSPLAELMAAGRLAVGNEQGVELSFAGGRALLSFSFPKVLEALNVAQFAGASPQHFSGSLTLAQAYSGGDVKVLTRPRVDFVAITGARFPALARADAGLIAVAPLPEGAAECASGRGTQIAFGERAPLDGSLGALCWDKGRLSYRAPDTAAFGGFAVAVPAGHLRLSVDAGRAGLEANANGGTGLHLLGRLEPNGAADPWGLRDSRLELRISIDLGSGVVTIPEQARENAPFYAHIRARAASVLPQGASVRRIEISSRGIELKVVGLEDALLTVAFESFFSDASIAHVANWISQQKLDPKACLTVRTAAIGRMLRTLEAPDKDTDAVLRLCEGTQRIALDRHFDPEEKATNNLRLPGQEDAALEWECRRGADTALSECAVRLPQLDTFCDRLEVRLSRGANFAAKGVTADIRGERPCVERLLKPLAPQGLGELLPTASKVRLDCPEGADLRTCAVRAYVPVKLPNVSAQLDLLPANDACEVPEDKPEDKPKDELLVGIRIGIDGSLRLDDNVRRQMNALGESLEKAIRCRLSSAAEAEVSRFKEKAAAWLNPLGRDLRRRLSELKDRAGFTCEAILSQPTNGKDRAPCDVYLATPEVALLSAPPRALLFTRAVTLFDTSVEIQATLAVDPSGRLAEPEFRVTCAACGPRLDELADKLSRMLANGAGAAVGYAGGASIAIADRQLRYQAPFTLAIPELSLTTEFRVSCALSVLEKEALRCDGAAPDPQAMLAGLIARVAKERLQADNVVVPLGPLEGRLTDAKIDGSKIQLDGKMAIPGLEPPVAMSITLPIFRHRFHVAFDEKTLTDTLGTQLEDQLNRLFGGVLPLKILNIAVSRNASNVPEQVRISSMANIQGLFTVSVPDVLLGRSGLKVDGPSELAIGFPPGSRIPVPPVSICPKSGSIGSARLVLFASATLADCTAETLLSLKGRLEINLRTPGIFDLRGDLVLLGFLSIGNTEAKLHLHDQYFTSVLDIGGPISSVIRFRSDNMRVQAKPTVRAEANGKLQIFRVPLNEQRLAIDFTKGIVDAGLRVNLFDVITANGAFGMEGYGRNPHARLEGSARVFGHTLGSLGIMARPNYAKVGFKVLGLGLTVVVPGLDTLSPDYLLKLIKKLLTPNFENLDQALLALLSGNITINPIASFGAGGDGAMDGSDGGSPKSGAEGLGENDAPGQPAPDNTPPGQKKVPPQGSSPTEPAKLNPPGRFHIDLVTAGEGFAVNLMEGPRLDTQIAAVAKHPLVAPIFDPTPDGRKAGVSLAFTKTTYTHLGDSMMTNTSIVGCPVGQLTPTVFAFSGVREPKAGYFELCRMRDASGKVLDQAQFTDPDYADLTRPFLTGLATVPSAMPRLLYEKPDEKSGDLHPNTPVRVLLTGFMGEVDLGAMGRVKMVAGAVVPGRLLIVANLPTDEGTCTTTPTAFGPRKIRALMMDVPDMARPLNSAELAKLYAALQGLAACKGSYATLAQIDGTDYITADGFLGRWNGSAYEMIRKPDPKEQELRSAPDPIILAIEKMLEDEGPPKGGRAPPAPPSPKDLEDLIKQQPPHKDAVALVDGGVGGSFLTLRAEGSGCVAQWSDGTRVTRYNGRDVGWSGCQPAEATHPLVVGVRNANDGDNGQLLLIESPGDPTLAHLVHLGWGKGQRLKFGAWQTRPGFAALDAAVHAFGAKMPLTLSGVGGFELPAKGAVAGPASIVLTDTDGRLRLAWGGDNAGGGIAMAAGVDMARAHRLAAMLASFAGDDRQAHPSQLQQAEPLAGSVDRLLLRPELSLGDAPLPVVDWSADGRWLLSARLVERPDRGSSRKAAVALLNERLAARQPAEPALDAWLFRLGPDQIGVGLATGDDPDEVLWQEREWTLPQEAAYGAKSDLVDFLAGSMSEFDVFKELCEIAWETKVKYFVRPWIGKDRSEASSALNRTVSPAEHFAALIALHKRFDKPVDCRARYLHRTGQPEVGTPEFFQAVRDFHKIDIPGGGASAGPPVFQGFEKRIAGFYRLNTPDQCHGVARALLALAKDDKLAGKRLVRLDESCRPGRVLLIAEAVGAVSEIAALRGGAFETEATIGGDPLPVAMLEQFRDTFATEGRAAALQLKGFLVPVPGRAPAWAAQGDDNALRVLLTEAGEAKTIEVTGLDGKSDALGDLIAFAVASKGDKFRVRRTSAGVPFMIVTVPGAETWLVTLDASYTPKAWVTLEGAGAPDGPVIDALVLMLDAAWGQEKETFSVKPGTPGARWPVASAAGTLAVRRTSTSPYLLFNRAGEVDPFLVTGLCATQLDPQTLLDLSQRIRKHFAREVGEAGDLAALLATLSGMDCEGSHPGVARFTPAELGASSGLLSGMDPDRRLLVAAYSPCETPGTCPFEPARTERNVPDALANGVLASLRTAVVHPDDPGGGLLLLHDSMQTQDVPAGTRTLMFGWREPHRDGGGPRDKIVYGTIGSTAEGAYRCLPGPISITINADAGDVAAVPLGRLKAPQRKAITDALLDYLRARAETLNRLHARAETLNQAAAKPDGSACVDLARMHPLVVLIGDKAAIFEEERANLEPEPVRPRRRAALPDAMGAGVQVASLDWVALAADSPAGSPTANRWRARPFLPNVKGEATVVTYPSALGEAERLRLLRALAAILQLTGVASIDFEAPNAATPHLLCGPFDEGTALVIDVGRTQARVVRLQQACTDDLLSWQVLEMVASGWGAPPGDERLPIPLRLYKGERDWLVVETAGENRVWSLKAGSTAELGMFDGELKYGDRQTILGQVGRDLQPFCALSVAPAGSSARIWYRLRAAAAQCSDRNTEGRLLRWLVGATGGWVPIETALTPVAVPMNAVFGFVPKFELPTDDVVQVSGKEHGPFMLARLASSCGPAERRAQGGTARLGKLRYVRDMSGGEHIDIPLDGEAGNCLYRDDLAPLLIKLSDDPNRQMALVALNGVRGRYSGMTMPALDLGELGARLLGFQGVLAKLVVGASSAAGKPAECAATGSAPPPVQPDWPIALAALATAFDGDAPATSSDGKPLHFLAVETEDKHGWLMAGNGALVEIEAPPFDAKPARIALSLPGRTFSSACARSLVARLLVAVRAHLGSLTKGAAWPDALVEDGEKRYIAALAPAHRFMVADADLAGVLLLVSHGFKDSDPPMVEDSALRRTLGAALMNFADDMLAAMDIHRVPGSSRFTALAGAARDGPVSHVGFWEDGRFTPIGLRTPDGLPLHGRRGAAIAAAIAQPTADGRVPSWRATELRGSKTTLRLCDAGARWLRLVAADEADVAMPAVDLTPWHGGAQLACAPLEGAGAEELIKSFRPGMTASAALVLAKDFSKGLLGIENTGAEYTLLRAGMQDTGCRSRLHGPGAAGMARALLNEDTLRCLEAKEFGDSGSVATAVIYSQSHAILLFREGCTVELAQHPNAKAPTGKPSATMIAFERSFRATEPCPINGRWFELKGERFAAFAGSLARLADGATFALDSAIPQHDLWLARWLLSPGVKDPKPSKWKGHGVPNDLLEVELGSGGERVYLSETKCLWWRGGDTPDGIHLQKALTQNTAGVAGGDYRCETAFIALPMKLFGGPILARVKLPADDYIKCLHALTGDTQFPTACLDDLALLNPDFSERITATSADDRRHLWQLMKDLLEPVASRRRPAEDFFRAMEPGLFLERVSWSPHYAYLLRGENPKRFFRFNSLGGVCREASEAAINTALQKRAVTPANGCGPAGDASCTLSLLQDKSTKRGALQDDPLWYRGHFNGDPRLLLRDTAHECWTP